MKKVLQALRQKKDDLERHTSERNEKLVERGKSHSGKGVPSSRDAHVECQLPEDVRCCGKEDSTQLVRYSNTHDLAVSVVRDIILRRIPCAGCVLCGARIPLAHPSGPAAFFAPHAFLFLHHLDDLQFALGGARQRQCDRPRLECRCKMRYAKTQSA